MFYAAAVVHGKDDKYLLISLCWGGEEAGGGSPRLQEGPGAPLPVGRQPGLKGGGLCSGGICAVHETRLVLTALPSEAVPLLLQLFGWVPNSRRKE